DSCGGCTSDDSEGEAARQLRSSGGEDQVQLRADQQGQGPGVYAEEGGQAAHPRNSGENWRVKLKREVEDLLPDSCLSRPPCGSAPRSADKMTVLNAVRAKKQLFYKDRPVRFYPDLAAGIHKKQKEFDAVRQKLCTMGIRYGMLLPAKLLVTASWT
ncbi:hypothetical protein KUCAC02_023782, partial [Chaenocephalus aceratus]